MLEWIDEIDYLCSSFFSASKIPIPGNEGIESAYVCFLQSIDDQNYSIQIKS